MQNTITQIGNYSFYNNKIVGQGATGLVYMGFRNSDKQPIAVKAIKLQDINTAVKKHLLDCQVLALKSIQHRYICQAYDVLKDNQFYYVPMEYFTNGSLRDYIKLKGKLPQSQALEMFQKIVQGYCRIRELGFMHRDLKTENILLRTNYEPAIIDFGYCEKLDKSNQLLTYNVGSPAYMSPEAYNDSCYSQKSDVWALGVVLHEMITGTIPVMRTTDVDEYFRYLRNMKNAQIVSAGQSQTCNRILRAAMAVDTRLRCSGIQLLNLVRSSIPKNVNSPTKSNNSNLNYEPYSPALQRSNSINRAQQGLQFRKAQPVRQIQLNPEPVKNWKFVPQQQINLVQTPKQGDSYSVKSNYSGSSQQSPVLRQTLPNSVAQQQLPQFMGLRKRIQSNANFNLNLTPVRNQYIENNPYQYGQSIQNQPMNMQKQANNIYRNQPMTAQLPQRNYMPDSPYGPRMKKSNSFGNLGVQLVHRF